MSDEWKARSESRNHSQQRLSSPFLERWGPTIVISLICSSVFLLFFQPLLQYTQSGIASLASNLSLKYVDKNFRKASVLESFDSISEIYSIISLMIGYFIISFGFFCLTVSRIAIQFLDTDGQFSHDDPIKIRRVAKLLQYMCVPVIFLAVLAPVLALSGNYIETSARATYSRRMMALAPVTTQVERDIINRKWALMKNRKDYEDIMSSIEFLAQKYNSTILERII